MTEAVYYHLMELGVAVSLSDDLRGLEIECAPEVLTPELVGLIREHKDGLVDLVFSMMERDAIQSLEAEAEKLLPPRLAAVTFEGDALLVERVRNHPSVRSLAEFLGRRGGGVIDVLPAEEVRYAA